MAEVILDTINGEQEYDIPLYIGERTFGAFCDFKSAEKKYWELVEEGNAVLRHERELEPLTPEEELENTKAITAAFEEMMSTIIEGNVQDIEFSIEGDSPKDLIADGYSISPEDDISLMRLYAHWVTLVDSYAPEKVPTKIRMDMNGTICKLSAARVKTLMLGDGTTTGQFLETLEFRRRAYYLAQNTKTESAGNIDFNLGTTEMALLVIPEGIRLPHKRGPLAKHINEWKKKWEFVPLDEVLTIRFFLVATIIDWAKHNVIAGFFNKQNPKQRQRKRAGRTKPNWKKKQIRDGVNKDSDFTTTSASRRTFSGIVQTLYSKYLKPK